MKALILCAGKGSRLGALCEDRPKPLLDVGGTAIVEHILMRLARHGVSEVYLNLHHHASAFPEHLGDGMRFGLKIHYLHEDTPLGTGGTSLDLLARLGEDLLVHYGDILTEHDLGALIAAHQRTDAAATVLLHQRAGSNSFAVLDAEDRVRAFRERPAVMPQLADGEAHWVFSGVCVLSPRCLEVLRGARVDDAGAGTAVLDLPRDLFEPLARQGRLFGQRLSGYRCAVDSQERLEAARRAYAGGRFKSQEEVL